MAELVDITMIDENPLNSAVSSPDGRVFLNLEILVMKATQELMMETLAAKLSGGPTPEQQATIGGKATILKMFMTASDGCKAAAALQREGKEVTRESVEKRIEADRLRMEKEVEAKFGSLPNVEGLFG